MFCPYCRQPLEPLVVGGRPTGAFQCVKCSGSWLQYQQLSSLLGGASGGSGATTAIAVTMASAPTTAAPMTAVASTTAAGPMTAAVSWHPDHRSAPGIPGGHQGVSVASTPENVGGGEGGFVAPVSGNAFRQPPFALPHALSLQGDSTKGAGERPKKKLWRRKAEKAERLEENPDWDICTYCGRTHPGVGRTCIHCNVERMHCPMCGAPMVGVRKYQVMVDLCLRCHGLFFEKGRLEALIERMVRGETGGRLLEGGRRSRPSLLQQLAAFLEDTEPDAYSSSSEGGVFDTVASAFGSGLKGSRQLLCDMLLMLGDIQPPRSRGPSGDSSGNVGRKG